MNTKDDALIEAMLNAFFKYGTDPDPERQFFRDNMRSALAVARKAILEEAAALMNETRGNILLHCGEMTSQELRSVEAVLRWKQDAIRSLANQEQSP